MPQRSQRTRSSRIWRTGGELFGVGEFLKAADMDAIRNDETGQALYQLFMKASNKILDSTFRESDFTDQTISKTSLHRQTGIARGLR